MFAERILMHHLAGDGEESSSKSHSVEGWRVNSTNMSLFLSPANEEVSGTMGDDLIRALRRRQMTNCPDVLVSYQVHT